MHWLHNKNHLVCLAHERFQYLYQYIYKNVKIILLLNYVLQVRVDHLHVMTKKEIIKRKTKYQQINQIKKKPTLNSGVNLKNVIIRKVLI
jgi:hypothetical protein